MPVCRVPVMMTSPIALESGASEVSGASDEFGASAASGAANVAACTMLALTTNIVGTSNAALRPTESGLNPIRSLSLFQVGEHCCNKSANCCAAQHADRPCDARLLNFFRLTVLRIS
jgi:hypothetical protein